MSHPVRCLPSLHAAKRVLTAAETASTSHRGANTSRWTNLRGVASSSSAKPSDLDIISPAVPNQHGPLFLQPSDPNKLSQLHAKLQRAGASRFDTLAEVPLELVEEDFRPTSQTYHHILHALARHGLLQESWALLADAENNDIPLNVQMFNYLVDAAQNVPHSIEGILDSMQKNDIQPNRQTYHYIIAHYANFRNVSMCLQTLHDMEEKSITPMLQSARLAIETAVDRKMPRLAFDVAMQFETRTSRRLEPVTWYAILESSTEFAWLEGVVEAWERSVVTGGVMPTEGLLNSILVTAGRHGSCGLATDVIRVLKQVLHVPIQEHHLASYVESLVTDGRIDEVVEFVNGRGLAMDGDPLFTTQELESLTTKETVASFSAWLATALSNVDRIWNRLENLHAKESASISLAALDIAIQGSVAHEDMGRAVAMYREAREALDVHPETSTLNILLQGCVKLERRDLAFKLLREARGLIQTPFDSHTYEHLILLCLTGSNYDDAFYYLEEMKGSGLRPTYRTYEVLANKALNNKDSRWRAVMEDLRAAGFKPQSKLHRAVRHQKYKEKYNTRSD